MRRELAVAGHDKDFAALCIGREQARRDPAGFHHILSYMVQAAALIDVRVAGDDRNAVRNKATDFLAHDDGIRRGDDETVDAPLLHAAYRLEIRARRAVFQLLDQNAHVIEATVVHRRADTVAHPADEKSVPARQNDADAVHAASGARCLPLRGGLVAVFTDELLNALAHLGRDVRTAVYHAVHGTARHAALVGDPLCSYLHAEIPFLIQDCQKTGVFPTPCILTPQNMDCRSLVHFCFFRTKNSAYCAFHP